MTLNQSPRGVCVRKCRLRGATGTVWFNYCLSIQNYGSQAGGA